LEHLFLLISLYKPKDNQVQISKERADRILWETDGKQFCKQNALGQAGNNKMDPKKKLNDAIIDSV
jgi:hypothetical protein